MSMVGNRMNRSSSGNMNMNMNMNMKNGQASFHEFKKQASFFFREKIKTARLALTDVTPAQLLAEEATNENPGGPDARTLKMISRAAFEVDDYWRIVQILHKRLARFEKRNWRGSYKAVIVLEHLLTHGPESVAEEFQPDADVISEMEKFQHIDEKGFNWGLTVRMKCERVLKLLEKGPLLKEERAKARKISRGIEGFGSFNHSTSPSGKDSPRKAFDRRCNSQFNDHSTTNDEEDFFSVRDENNMTQTKTEKPLLPVIVDLYKTENLRSLDNEASKENMVPGRESRPLLDEKREDVESRVYMSMEQHHPFDDAEHVTAMSLLSTTECR